MHPTAVFLQFMRVLREMAIPFVLALFVGGSNQFIPWLNTFNMLLLLLSLSIVYGWFRWWLFKYWLEDGEFKIEQGVMVRQKRFIRQERIQSVDISSGLIHRLLGVVRVRIETAGSGSEPEIYLQAVKYEEAAYIKRVLLSKNAEKHAETVLDHSPGVQFNELKPVELEEASVIKRLGRKELVFMALTSSGIGLAFSAFGALFSQLFQFLPQGWLERTFGTFITTGWMVLIFFVIIAAVCAYLFSAVGTMLKYGGFILKREGDDFVINRGVLEKRELTLSVKRITAVRVVEPLLRQPFGYVSIYVESAGGGTAEEQLSTIMYPLIRSRELNHFFSQFLPDYVFNQPVLPLPRRAYIRYLIKPIALLLALCGLFIYFVPYGYLSLLMIPITIVWVYYQYKDAGYATSQHILLFRTRLLERQSILVKRSRIQAFTITQSIFQKKAKLITPHISVKSSIHGKSFLVRHTEQEVGLSLMQWFSQNE